ncbi:zinc finger protein 568 [Coregonus clupeaformis]|uniref:zinc finger protein 568 n=1 Tax=Coregonus clupeaformis TaxID=59861 RepID=UPI001BE11657|nr:zinc finger protein 568 [Coregonus clupeaformis]
MSKIQLLRVFLNERLTAAAEEIFGVVEKTIAEYQEEVVRLQRLLDIDIVLQPEKNLHRADVQQLAVSEEEVPPEQQHCEQEWSPSLVQEDPEPTQIKEEQEELRTSQEEEQIQGLEADTIEFIFKPVCVKSDCDEDPTQLSHLYQAQKEGNGERDTLPNTKTEKIKTEPDGEIYVEAEPTGVSQPFSTVHPDCSADQSENSQRVSGMETGGLQSGFKPVISKRTKMVKGQRSHINTKGRESTQLSLLKSPSRSNYTRCCCKVCGKSFLQMGSLVKHVQTHKKDEGICGVCGKCFQSTESMKDHFQTHIAASFCCDVCSKGFSKNSKLIVHMRIHTGESPYRCCHCGKGFKQNGSLKIHMRIHTGEKPFSCPVCGSCFSQNGDLKIHMRIHTGEKPYSCCHCGQGFNQKGNLKTHMRTHTREKPYHCHDCGQGFSTGSALKRHIMIHTGEKPFCCPDCGKTFNRSGNVKLHMRIHKGKK